MRLTHYDEFKKRWQINDDYGAVVIDDLNYAVGEAIDKLAAYEDAEEQGRLVILPCKVGDKIRDKIADHLFTIQEVELGHKAGTLFRCGNPGTEDYAAFCDFEIEERFGILGREEAEAARIWRAGRCMTSW